MLKHLPENHNFKYIAAVPWPESQPQIDWVDQIESMEYWLNTYIGPHYKRWAWGNGNQPAFATVAFKFDKHKCLFLLNYN